MWKMVKLGDVCKITNGSTPLRKEKRYWAEGNIPWFTIDDLRVQGKNITHTKQNVTQAAVDDKKVKLVSVNSVLLCCTASIGAAAIARVEMATNQQFNALTPKSAALNSDYLYFVATTLTQTLLSVSGSTTINFVSMSKLKEISIPLPPLAEQERIVAKLDAAFAEIDESIRAVKNKIKEISSLYENAVTAEFSNIADCLERKLSDVCEKITDGTHQTPKYFDEGYIFLSSKNVTSRKIDWDNVKYIDEAQHIQMHKRIAPRIGDVLLAKNGTTGVAAIVDRDIVFDIYVSLAWLRSKGDVLPEYLLEFVNSKMAKEQFTSRTKGIGVPNLHLKEIREVIIRFPEEKEKQELIVKKLKNIDDACSSYRQINERKLLNLAYLKSAILSQELQSSEAA
ncbi:restriction endonuclease subunit S [Pseudomonadota bacterium]|nr:restriction endonuclease subunit S [Pseudomonadota bacterium]